MKVLNFKRRPNWYVAPGWTPWYSSVASKPEHDVRLCTRSVVRLFPQVEPGAKYVQAVLTKTPPETEKYYEFNRDQVIGFHGHLEREALWFLFDAYHAGYRYVYIKQIGGIRK